MDAMLTAFVGFLQLLLGAMGIYVSLKPPMQKHHRYWIGGFMGIGILAVLLTGWLAHRGSSEQEKATERITEAVTAATKANTAATDANNSALAAQRDVRDAREEARTAKDDLAKLINKTSQETSTELLKLSTETQTSFKAIGTTLSPPPRRIEAQYRTQLISFFSDKPATVRIQAIENDIEAYHFAQDWYDILKAAGWTIEGDRISTFMVSGEPLQGVNLKYHGQPLAPNATTQVPKADPIGHIIIAMNALKVSFTGQRSPDIPEGTIVMDFYSRPTN